MLLKLNNSENSLQPYMLLKLNNQRIPHNHIPKKLSETSSDNLTENNVSTTVAEE